MRRKCDNCVRGEIAPYIKCDVCSGKGYVNDENVIPLPVITTHDLDPDRALISTVGELTHVVIVGYDKDGNEYFASSIANGPDVLWLLDRARLKLLRMVDCDAK